MTTIHRFLAHAALAGAGLALGMPALAVVAYDEATQGDLSNDGLAPTPIVFGVGDNDLLGASGVAGSSKSFLDYGTFTVPVNTQLTAVRVLPSTVGIESGDLLFLGLQPGNQLTVNPTTYAGQQNLIGWNHFSADDVGHDLALNGDGNPSPLPLAAGQYSFWVQDYDDGVAPYGLRFSVESIAAVPEPQTYALMALGLAVVGGVAARRRNGR